jgi:hypothetical protein
LRNFLSIEPVPSDRTGEILSVSKFLLIEIFNNNQMHDQYYLFDIQLEIINDFGVIKKERNAYGEIVQMQAREVVWKYRIAGGLTGHFIM